jgi:hypothetical protein
VVIAADSTGSKPYIINNDPPLDQESNSEKAVFRSRYNSGQAGGRSGEAVLEYAIC